MRFGYCEAHSFKNQELMERLVLYCRDHLIDCLFISGDQDGILRKELEPRLLQDHVIFINNKGKVEINGIKCELNDAYLIVEYKVIMPLSGCLNSIVVIDGNVQSQYICMEILLQRKVKENDSLDMEIDHQIDKLLRKIKGKKERKFN